MTQPTLEIHPDAAGVVADVATRLLARLAEVQAQGRVPTIALTGGTISRDIHREVARLSAGASVDWSQVEVFWGDDRFVPADDPERNSGQAREDLLDHVGVDPGRVHAMPASDDPAIAGDVDAAAAAYADVVTQHAPDGFDVLMLGLGPDGHCASLFPGAPALTADGVAVGVRNSPKPPPERVSLTFEALNRHREVWWLVSGAAKADAVAAALAGGDPAEIPARGISTDSATWFLDDEAVSSVDVV